MLPTPDPPSVAATSNAGEMPDPYEPVPERVFAQPEDIQEETDLPPVEKDPPEYPNLDSNLNRLAQVAEPTLPDLPARTARGRARPPNLCW